MSKLYLVVGTLPNGKKKVEGIYSSILKADGSVTDADGQSIVVVNENALLPATLGPLVFSPGEDEGVTKVGVTPLLKNAALASQAAYGNNGNSAGEYDTDVL